MVQFRWPKLLTGPLQNVVWAQSAKAKMQATVDSIKSDGSSDDEDEQEADDLELAIDADSHDLCGKVLENVVAKIEGRKGDPALLVAALARRLPEQDAAHELLQLAALDREPYKGELQSALNKAGVIPALATALCGNGTSQAKLHVALALCSIGRNSPRSRPAAKVAAEEAFINCLHSSIVDVTCFVYVVDALIDGDICQPSGLIELLSSVAEENASDIDLQRRISTVLQALVKAGTISKSVIRKRDLPLLSTEWTELLSRFQKSETEDERLQNGFHAEVQAMFHEEVVRQFEFEAVERNLQMHRERREGTCRLHEVIRCFVENLEDYESRLDARDVAWDVDTQRVAPLDASLRARLGEEVQRKMEPGLILALKAAAHAPYDRRDSSALRHRRSRLRSECKALMNLKQVTTEEHEEEAAELRREVVLVQVLRHLESHVLETSAAQIRTTISMFNIVETSAPIDAVESLRKRLEALAAQHNLTIVN